MVVLQPLCQVIYASDWSEIARELQWQVVVKVQLIETFALRHNHQNNGSSSPAIGPCSLHPSLFQAKQASWQLREEGRSFSITREPALELDFGWHSILLTIARQDDYQEYFNPSVDHDLNILRVARFDRPRKLLTALSFKELEPMLRSRLNAQGTSMSWSLNSSARRLSDACHLQRHGCLDAANGIRKFSSIPAAVATVTPIAISMAISALIVTPLPMLMTPAASPVIVIAINDAHRLRAIVRCGLYIHGLRISCLHINRLCINWLCILGLFCRYIGDTFALIAI